MTGRSWVLRSLLFVPGSQPRMLSKAHDLGADAIILDLEDAVAADQKSAARRNVHQALTEGFPDALVVVLRVNSLESGLLDRDLAEAYAPRVDAICLPKCHTTAEVQAIDARLGMLEDRTGVSRGTVRLLPMIESARGVVEAPAIGRACRRVWAIGFGAEDFTADMGIRRTREGGEIAWARAAVSLAAHAAGTEPIDGIFADFHDAAGLREDAAQARRLGYTGKMLIHPAQIEPVHDVFAATPDEVAHARRVIDAFEAASASGSGVAVVDGVMIDRPVVLRAQRVLAIAGRG
jgi:citrate lyase subunit beta / citryl-CoA lyase